MRCSECARFLSESRHAIHYQGTGRTRFRDIRSEASGNRAAINRSLSKYPSR